MYTLVLSMISYLGIFNLGCGNALIRYSARLRAQGEDPKNLNEMFLSLYLVIGAVTLLLGMFIYRYVDRFYAAKLTAQEIELLKSMFALMLINTALSFPASVFSSVIWAREEFVFSRCMYLANNLVSHVVSAMFLFQGGGALAVVRVNVVCSIAVYVANLVYCVKKLHIRFGFARFPKAFYREIFLYCLFIFTDMLITQLYDSTDKILLGRFVGSASVAVYGVGVTFQNYYQYLSASIANIYLPYISALAVQENGMEQMEREFVRVGRLQFLMLAFVLCGFVVYGQEFMLLWVGPEYRDAYWIALVIMVPALFTQAQTIGISILHALNRHRVRSMMMLVIAVFNVAISIPMAIRWGGIGAALGTAIGLILGQIFFMNWYYYRKIGLDIPGCWRRFAGMTAQHIPVLLVFLLTDRLLPGGAWPRLILKGGLGVLLALPYHWCVVLKKEERSMLLSYLKKRKR